MRFLVRTLHLLGATCAIGLSACGDSTSPVHPASLSVVEGDRDSGVTGSRLTLRVLVAGSDGRALSGAVVTWTVQAGPSTLATPTSTSGGDGTATNTVTLAGDGVQTTIAAAAQGTAPVTITVTSLIDPCSVLQNLALGATANGTLTNLDCRISDSTLIDFYQFVLPALDGVTLTMNSASFDPYIFLLDTQSNTIAVDDNSGPGSNALLRAILPAGSYVVGANAFAVGTSGPYSLGVQQPGVELNACEYAWTAKGVAMSQQLTTATCSAPDGTLLAADHLRLVLDQGQALTVNLTSATFAARVVIYDGSGFIRTAASAAGPGATASVTFTSTALDGYWVQLGAVGGATGGAYQVTFQ
jgi:hypothetical protein